MILPNVIDRAKEWPGPWAELRDWAMIILMDYECRMNGVPSTNDELVECVRSELEPVLERLETSMLLGRGEQTMDEVLDNM